MNFNVINEHVKVGCIHLISVTSASVLKVGDSECIQMYSASDTPPQALEFGPLQAITAK